MMDILEVGSYRAVVQDGLDIDMFQGEFIGLNAGADFYAKDIDSLRQEGENSLKVFLEMRQEDGVVPRKNID